MARREQYVYEKVASALLRDIAAKKFPESKRLPGCRLLGERYGVNMQTARQAVDKLEKAGALQRMRQRGTYICHDFFLPGKKSCFAFVYSSDPMKLLAHSVESWNIFTEILRGITMEALAQNADVRFELMHETEDSFRIGKQLEQLTNCEGVIFVGLGFSGLRNALLEQGKKVQIIRNSDEDMLNIGTIGCPLNIAYTKVGKYVSRAGYKRVDICMRNFVSSSAPVSVHKLRALESALEMSGITDIHFHESTCQEELADLLKFRPARLIYTMNTSALPLIYHYAFEHGLVPGRDFDILAYATGYTFSNFYPKISFFCPGFANFGKIAIDRLASVSSNEVPLEPEFYQGESSRVVTEFACR